MVLFKRTGPELAPLSFANKLASAVEINVPDARLGGQAFEANFSFVVGSGSPGPHHHEFRLHAVVLNVHDLAWPQWAAHPFEQGTILADVHGCNQLHERKAIGVDAPNPDRQQSVDSRLASAVHVLPTCYESRGDAESHARHLDR